MLKRIANCKLREKIEKLEGQLEQAKFDAQLHTHEMTKLQSRYDALKASHKTHGYRDMYVAELKRADEAIEKGIKYRAIAGYWRAAFIGAAIGVVIVVAVVI